MADRVRRDERAIEMNTLDERVNRDHLDAVTLRLDDRRVVADADEQPRRRRGQPAADTRDELALRAVGNHHFA